MSREGAGAPASFHGDGHRGLVVLSGVGVLEEGVRIELHGEQDFSGVGDRARSVDADDDGDAGRSAGRNVPDAEGLGGA